VGEPEMDERVGFAEEGRADWLEDWQTGRRLNTRGRNKIVLAAGMLSRSGEALDRFDGFIRYLITNHGYDVGDFLELSYNSVQDVEGWRPIPYDSIHCEAGIADVTAHVGRGLRWYRSILPYDTRYHLIGYSLGGVTLFEASAALLFGEPERWQGRIGSLITLAAPLFGTDLGLEGDLLSALGFGSLLPTGVSVRELVARGSDPLHRASVERIAARLRAQGVNLLTLADAEDVVVTPADAVIAPLHERDWYVLSSQRQGTLFGGGGVRAPLGHGPLLTNTLAWVRMAKTIGPQEPRAG
jgi:hypothetical protein